MRSPAVRSPTPLSPLLVALVLPGLLAGCNDCDGQPLRPLLGRLEVVPAELAFGEAWAGYPKVREVQLTNVGEAAVALLDVAGPDHPAFVVTGAVPELIDAEEAVAVEIAFSPFAFGPAEGQLVLHTDADDSLEVTVTLRGEGRVPPACHDDNDCTEDVFDPVLGVCVPLPREGACEDGSACTQGSICVDGRCLGEAVPCVVDEHECRRGLCDAELGCTAVLDPGACFDDDPCTDDVCDEELGCLHTVHEDGTPCGPFLACAAQVCLQGACQLVALADGTPCTDGSLCTAGDTCQAGQCAGVWEEQPPSPVGGLHTWGSWAIAEFVGDDLVVADGHTATLTLLDAATLQVRGELEIEGSSPFDRLVPLGEPRFAAWSNQGLRVFSVSGNSIVEVAHLSSVAYGANRVAAKDDRLFTCLQGVPNAAGWDLSDPANPIPLDLDAAAGLGCRFLVVDPSGTLWLGGDAAIASFSLEGGAVTPLTGPLSTGAISMLAPTPAGVAYVESSSAATVRLLDPSTGVSTVLAEYGSLIGYFTDLRYDGQLLAAASNHLIVLDMEGPSPGQPLLEQPIPGGGGARVRRHGDRLVFGRLAVLDLAPDLSSATFVTTPQRGTLGLLVEEQGQVYSLSSTTLHRLDVTAPEAPALVAGGAYAAGLWLFRLSAAQGSALQGGALAPYFHDYGATGYGPGFYVDASDVDHPLVGEWARFGGAPYWTRSVALAGTRMVALHEPNALAVNLELYDLEGWAGGLALPLWSSPHPVPLVEPEAMGVAADEREDGLYAATLLWFDDATGDQTHVDVFRIEEDGPEGIASLQLEGAYSRLRFHGTRLVLDGAGSPVGTGLTWLTFENGALSEGPSVLDGVAGLSLLHLDDDILLAATEEPRLYYLDPHTGGLLQDLALPHPVQSALSRDEHLLLAGPSRLTVLHPPCPAPPD